MWHWTHEYFHNSMYKSHHVTPTCTQSVQKMVGQGCSGLENAIGLENQADTCLCILSCVSSIVGNRVAVTCYARLSCTRKLLQFTPTFYAMVPSSAILSLKETKDRPNPCLKHGDSKNALHGLGKIEQQLIIILVGSYLWCLHWNIMKHHCHSGTALSRSPIPLKEWKL